LSMKITTSSIRLQLFKSFYAFFRSRKDYCLCPVVYECLLANLDRGFEFR